MQLAALQENNNKRDCISDVEGSGAVPRRSRGMER